MRVSPTMTMMHTMLRRLTLLLAAAAAVIAAGCGGGDGGNIAAEPLTPQRLLQSASASAEARTARFAFEMEMTMPGVDEPLSLSGEGAFDADARRASMSFDMASFARGLGQAFGGLGGGSELPLDDPDKWRIDAVQDGLTLYLRFPLFEEKLPAGKSWVEIDVGEAAKAQGFDLEQLTQLTENDPRKTLDYLRAVAGKIVPVGEEEVRGVDTTRYKATLDLAEYAKLAPAGQRAKLSSMLGRVMEQAGLRYVPVDLWVDGEGLVRRMTMELSISPNGGAESAEMTMTFELFEYGEPVEIALPPAAEVVDLATLQRPG